MSTSNAYFYWHNCADLHPRTMDLVMLQCPTNLDLDLAQMKPPTTRLRIHNMSTTVAYNTRPDHFPAMYTVAVHHIQHAQRCPQALYVLRS